MQGFLLFAILSVAFVCAQLTTTTLTSAPTSNFPQVYIQTSDNRYIQANPLNGNTLTAVSNVALASVFQLGMSGSSYTLKTVATSQYVSARNNGASPLQAISGAAQGWEFFTLTFASGTATIQFNGNYVTVQSDNLLLPVPAASSLSSFTIQAISIKPVEFAFTSVVTIQPAGTNNFIYDNSASVLTTTSNSALATQYILIDQGGLNYAILDVSLGLYVSARPTLTSEANRIASWETYTFVSIGANFAIKSARNNLWVCLQSDNTLAPTTEVLLTTSTACQFSLTYAGGGLLGKATSPTATIATLPTTALPMRLRNTGLAAGQGYLSSPIAGGVATSNSPRSVADIYTLLPSAAGTNKFNVLKVTTRLFLSADNAGAAPTVINRPAANSWEVFTLAFDVAGSGYLTLQAVNGGYLTASSDGSSVSTTSTTVTPFSLWAVESLVNIALFCDPDDWQGRPPYVKGGDRLIPAAYIRSTSANKAFALEVPFNVRIGSWQGTSLFVYGCGIISSDGTFSSSGYNRALPAKTMNSIQAPALFVIWYNNYYYGGDQNIYYKTVGDAPNRIFQMNYVSSSYDQGWAQYNVVVTIYENNPGVFTVQYLEDNEKGKYQTVGIQDTGSFKQYSHRQEGSIPSCRLTLVMDTVSNTITADTSLITALAKPTLPLPR